MSNKKILIIEPQSLGHQQAYMETLLTPKMAKRLFDAIPEAEVDILMPKQLKADLDAHLTKQPDMNNIRLLEINTEFVQRGMGKIALITKILKQCWKRNYNSIFLMYGDDFLLSLPLMLLFSRMARIGGLFFRPVFHYKKLGFTFYWRGRIKNERMTLPLKNLLMTLFIRSNLIKESLFLDHEAAKFLQSSGNNASPCPDPIITDQLPAAADNDRVRMMLFGNINHRKGLDRIANAMRLLPDSLLAKITIDITGRVFEPELIIANAMKDELTPRGGIVNVNNTYIQSNSIANTLCTCNVLLLPYCEHIGSSNVLLQSAYWNIPVISHDFGLLGYYTDSLKLGLTVDTSNPKLFADAIAEMTENHSQFIIPEASRKFAAGNTSEAFSHTIIDSIISLTGSDRNTQ